MHYLTEFLKQTSEEHCQETEAKRGRVAELRLKANFLFIHSFIHPFIYAFIQWSEFFRIDLSIDLSSYRKYWLLRPEDPGVSGRKEYLFR